MNGNGKYARIVVKVGSSSLTYDNGKLNLRRIDRLARTLADLHNSGLDVVLVSSGAIAVGISKMGLDSRPSDLPGKQAAAAIGQLELMYIYDKIFSEYGKIVAQVLLTRDVVDHSEREQHVRNTFARLIGVGAIPIVNENDTVAVEEIVFGDNDTLSAIVSVLVGADLLILMSDIDGLFDSDPRSNSEAKLVREVAEIDESIYAMSGGAGSKVGTGGMQTKINAAEIATASGIDMAIVNSDDPAILYDIIKGDFHGTLFRRKV